MRTNLTKTKKWKIKQKQIVNKQKKQRKHKINT